MAPVLRDLARSFWDTDWHLHLSFVSRTIDLSFSFDRISYKRWLPIYSEDCLALPKRFLKMYQSFLNRDSIVRHSSRKCSAVPMDLALEKAYNKPAKSSACIIGFTGRKQSIETSWTPFVKWMRMTSITCNMNFQIGLSKQTNSVAALMKNVLPHGNPFNLEQPKGVMNIATGAILQKDKQDFLMNCISLGKAARNEFYESRLPEKNI